MIPEFMRFCCHEGFILDEAECWVYDADQRRWIVVSLPLPVSFIFASDDDRDDEWAAIREKAQKLVTEHIDKAPGDTVGIKVDGSDRLTFVSDLEGFLYDPNRGTYYPLLSEFQLPENKVKTVLRSELTELERLSVHVDLVSYPGTERGAFKYSHHHRGFGSTWQEIQIHARLPRHANILPMDRLVLDEMMGTRVVGFTTPFIPGGSLDTNTDRPFKLKHLKQLTEVVDDLNYKYGIVHHDMAPRNLFIDPSTDDLVLFDFSVAAKIGYEIERDFGEVTRALEERNDVKGVILTVHELLTRDPRYKTTALHYLDETDLLDQPEKWVKHPDVRLDPGLEAVDYFNELMRWVRARRERPIKVYTEASEPIDWPTLMPAFPSARLYSYTREEAKEHNLPYIEWFRPRSAHLDRSRRLLATGRYADEVEGNGAVDNQEHAKSRPENKADQLQNQVETDSPETKTAIATVSPRPETKRRRTSGCQHADQSNAGSTAKKKKRAHPEALPSSSPITARAVGNKTKERTLSEGSASVVRREEPLRKSQRLAGRRRRASLPN